MVVAKTAKAASDTIRAVGYCRTSGEGQRDNTSIPRQRDAIEAYCKHNGWLFVCHYVDESKTGSKEDGRDEFQQMLRDAANNKFDMVVVFDIKRFSRDGADIIRNATFLRANFNVHVVDTKNQFDTRDRQKTLGNYVHAGMSEHERLEIMERMIGGRVRRAQDGLPWSGHPPVGRAFRKTSKNKGEWYVTERGEKLRDLLTRYADGEPFSDLVKEYGFSSTKNVLSAVRSAQLSGTYVVTFHAPEIDIVDLKVPIPSMMQVITPELEKRVRKRMQHNRTWNKENLRKYLLSSFTFCANCGCALTSSQVNGIGYYRHNKHQKETGCNFHSITAPIIEPAALDYLFNFFLDKPAFDAAVKQSMPTSEDRQSLEKEIEKTRTRFAKVSKSIANLVNAIADGADAGLFIGKQFELKDEKQVVSARLNELESQLAAMPDPSRVAHQAMMIRLQLVQKHKGKDWRKLPFDDVRKFLSYLFGDNTKKTGHGIFVAKVKDKWRLTFKGNVKFHSDVVNGRAIPHLLTKEVERQKLSLSRKLAAMGYVEPDLDNSLSVSRSDKKIRIPPLVRLTTDPDTGSVGTVLHPNPQLCRRFFPTTSIVHRSRESISLMLPISPTARQIVQYLSRPALAALHQ